MNYEVISDAINAVRGGVSLGKDWKRIIDEDYKKRNGRRCK